MVANRLPVERATRAGLRWQRSPGGLVSAMEPVVSKRGALWIGWDGSAGRAPAPAKLGRMRLRAVGLSRTQVEGYYQGFSNGTLWPLYHDAVWPPEIHRKWWGPYRDVNLKFASAAARHAPRHARVWVHDYHLQLVPWMLRERRPDLTIGLFLHIPFPPEELFSWLPWRTPILKGLMGADVLGFQTESSSSNFARVAKRFLGCSGTERELEFAGRRVRLLPCPISIDTERFMELAASPDTRRKAAEIREKLSGRKIILSVDRLDYTKGIPARLRAFEELLKERRVSAEDVVHVQVAVPSRESMPGYLAVRREVEEIVGRINGEYSHPGMVPVHYYRRSFSAEDLAAWYVAADVMVVTPLRDGMNLVAKEYVACRTNHDGVLVLSEFAGAARELRRALLVNPRDIEAVKSALVQAIRMPARDASMRMAILRTQVKRHTVADWSGAFLDELS